MRERMSSFTGSLRLLLMTVLAVMGLSCLVYAGAAPGTGAGQPGQAASTPDGGQLNDAANASGDLRKSQGLMRGTTHNDRKAAARRTAERKAQYKKLLKAKGGATP